MDKYVSQCKNKEEQDDPEVIPFPGKRVANPVKRSSTVLLGLCKRRASGQAKHRVHMVRKTGPEQNFKTFLTINSDMP